MCLFFSPKKKNKNKKAKKNTIRIFSFHIWSQISQNESQLSFLCILDLNTFNTGIRTRNWKVVSSSWISLNLKVSFLKALFFVCTFSGGAKFDLYCLYWMTVGAKKYWYRFYSGGLSETFFHSFSFRKISYNYMYQLVFTQEKKHN